jgi:hypothetical protein
MDMLNLSTVATAFSQFANLPAERAEVSSADTCRLHVVGTMKTSGSVGI